MAPLWDVGKVTTFERPGGIGNLHLWSLRAGAWGVKIIGRGRPWFWMSRVTVVLRHIFPGTARATFCVFGSRLIEVDLADDYWIPSILLCHANEPEILDILPLVLGPDSCFVDAGANIGWWSLLASTMIPDPSRIIAVEPIASTFRDLLRNAELNGMPFRCERAAVWSRGGEQLSLSYSGRAREGAHVDSGDASNGQAVHVELVPSVSLGEIIGRSAGNNGMLVIKLDVEGAEILALQGMRERAHQVDLIIYEDHGKDQESRVTAAVLQLGFEVFFANRSGRTLLIGSAEEARSMKLNIAVGYNFFAVRPGSALAGMFRARAAASA